MPKAGIQFSKKDEWYTPKEVVDHFAKFVTFDYDPATSKEQAEKFGIPFYDTIETDGLKTDWTKFNCIWCNPPFTKKFDFLKKAVECKKLVYFLTPIETLTTKRFAEIAGHVPYNMFVPNGRIKFVDPDGGGSQSPAFGTVVLVFGGDGREIMHWRLYD